MKGWGRTRAVVLAMGLLACATMGQVIGGSTPGAAASQGAGRKLALTLDAANLPEWPAGEGEVSLDAISREFSVFNIVGLCATDAVSAELSVFNDTKLRGVDAVSAELSVFNDVGLCQTDAVSAEFSVFNEVSLSRVDAVSAELTVFNNVGLYATDAISSEITVHNGFAIRRHPASQTAKTGATVTFSVDACGFGTLTYQWRRAGENLSDDGHFSGAKTDTLTIQSMMDLDVAGYDVVVTCGQESLPSDLAVLSSNVVDLVPVYSRAEEPALAGKMLHVEWQVKNTSEDGIAGGGFVDAVYFSMDNLVGQGDVLLASVWHDAPVGSQQVYQASADVLVPGVLPGSYHILVRTDAKNQIGESNKNNNLGVSDPLAVDHEVLTLGTGLTGQFTGGEKLRYYKVTVQEGKDLRVRLDDADGKGANELYARYELIPSRSSFDFRYQSTFAANQEILIPNTRAGTYYILAYADNLSTAEAAFEMTAEYMPLTVRAITPSRSGNTTHSVPTVSVQGAAIDPRCTIAVRREGQEDILPRSISWINTGLVLAELDFRNVQPGTWQIVVTNPDGQSISTPFTIIDGGIAKLETKLILPGALGFHIASTLYIEYANTGDGPMAAPLLVLHGTQNVMMTVDPALAGPGLWTDTPPAGLTDTLQILALGNGPDPSVLNPDERGRIPVYYRGCKLPWDFNRPPIEFTLGGLTEDDTSLVDWPSLKDGMKPELIKPEAWDLLWGNVTASIGTTWGQYVSVLDKNAGYLASLGQRVTDIRQLLAFQLMQAQGLSPMPVLSRQVDASVPTPGLPLVFAREYRQGIIHRNETGPLGKGWRHNWQISTERKGFFQIHTLWADGSRRIFVGSFSSLPNGGFLGGFEEQGGHAYISAVSTLDKDHYYLHEPDGTQYAFRFLDGILDFVEDLNGNRISLGYAGNQLTSLTHSSGQSFTLAYSGDRIQSIHDNLGRTVTYTYDGTGEHLMAMQDNDGRTMRYAYNTNFDVARLHALTQIEWPGGNHQYFTWDPQGRLESTCRDDQAEMVTFEYGPGGKVAAADSLSNQSSFYFDQYGQLVKTQDPLGSAVQMAYDDQGQLVRITDPAGHFYTYGYDHRGNVAAVTDALGHTNSFTYTTYGRLDTLTDANGNRTDYDYDMHGNLTRIAYADDSFEGWTYDDLGNAATWKNRRGHVVSYAVDSYGRVTCRTYRDGTAVRFTYDNRGNLLTTVDPMGTTTFTYNDAEQLTRIDYPAGRWLSYTYDVGGRRTSMQDHVGHRTNYHYDDAGRLWYLTDENDNEIVRYHYDPVGRLSRTDKGNGTYTTYEYDAAGQLLHLLNCAPDGGINSRFDYTYDSRGRRTGMGTLDGIWTYGYDDLGQLTHAVFLSMNPLIESQDLRYFYDAMGNRTRTIENGKTMEYKANNLNQYTQVGSTSCRYDNDGNLIRESSSDGDMTYTYDDNNRLIGVSGPSGTQGYTYDALGNRNTVTRGGEITAYLIDPAGLGNVVAEYKGNGDLVATYAHALGLVGCLNPAGTVAYYDYDAIGSAVGLSDQIGLCQNTYSYTPFGDSLYKTETLPNAYQFVGQLGLTADGSGAYFMRTRYYCTRGGRFKSADRVGLATGLNLYAYCLNNPLAYVDPAGTYGTYSGDLVNPSPAEFRCATAASLFIEVVPWIMMGKYIYDMVPYWDAAAAKTYFDTRNGPTLSDNGPQMGPFPPRPKKLTEEELNQLYREVVKPVDLSKANNEWKHLQLQHPPKPNSQTLTDGQVTPVGSMDPNDKLGVAGFGDQGFIAADERPLTYTIYFENEPDATAAACQVRIEDQLNDNLDWMTFELVEVCFGSHHVTIPAGMSHYNGDLNIDGWTYSPTDGWRTGETPLKVSINAGIDIATSRLTWKIGAVNPDTGLPPEDAYAGFLPPDDAEGKTGRGQGFVTYLVKAKKDLPSGTQITNKADIIFDYNPVIETPQTLHTIDASTPSSQVRPLPITSTRTFTVSWTGEDELGGSGIASYDIYVSQDGAPYGIWQQASTETSASFTGQVGHTYRFYSIATDNVGHKEAPPAGGQADTVVSVTRDYSKTTLAITGPAKVQEGRSSTYKLTATYDDGSTADVTAAGMWSVSSGSGSFAAAGTYVAPLGVTADAPVTLQASYAEGGITMRATLAITVTNAVRLLEALAISGPATVLAGQSGSYKATATYDDGSTLDVTAHAEWLLVSGPGTFTAAGTYAAPPVVTADTAVTLKATYSEGGLSKQVTKRLTVLLVQKPTFTLSIETSTSSQASIEVKDPAGRTTSNLTNFQQDYAAGSTVTVTAPEALGDEHFVKWMLDGDDYSADRTATVQMDAAHMLVAVYEGTVTPPSGPKCGTAGSENLPILGAMCMLGLCLTRMLVRKPD